MKIFKNGEYVLYKSLDDNLSFYKVITANSGIGMYIQKYGREGKINQKFWSSLKDKNGRQRILKSWLQIGDKLVYKNKVKGSIRSIFVDNEDGKLFVEFVTEKSQEILIEYIDAYLVLTYI